MANVVQKDLMAAILVQCEMLCALSKTLYKPSLIILCDTYIRQR